MGNVDFSEIGMAILGNKPLAGYIIERLGRISEMEKAAGQIVIRLKRGEEEHDLKLKVGPRNEHRLQELMNNKKPQP